MGVFLKSSREQVFKEQEASARDNLASAQFVLPTIHRLDGALQGFGDFLRSQGLAKQVKIHANILIKCNNYEDPSEYFK
jgi:hypothetical protein